MRKHSEFIVIILPPFFGPPSVPSFNAFKRGHATENRERHCARTYLARIHTYSPGDNRWMSPFIEFHARISSFSIQTRLYYEVILSLSLRNFDPIHVFVQKGTPGQTDTFRVELTILTIYLSIIGEDKNYYCCRYCCYCYCYWRTNKRRGRCIDPWKIKSSQQGMWI